MGGSLDVISDLGADGNDVGVDKECQDFPKSFEGRRLGESLDLLNTSSAEFPKSQGHGSVRGRVSPYHTDAMNITLTPKNSTFVG